MAGKLTRGYMLVMLASITSMFVFCSMFSSLSPQAVSISLNESTIVTADETVPSEFIGRIPKAERSILYTEYGMYRVRDTITYYNDGTKPVQEFYLCINHTNARGLYGMTTTAVSGARLHASKKPYSLNGFATWGIILQAPLMPGETTQFTVEQFFDGHMAWTMNETTVTVYFEHSVNPVSPYELDTLTTKMKLTNNARVLFSDPQGSTSSGVTTFTIQRVVPFKHTPLNVLFTNPEGRIVETNRATITVLPSNFNDWRVTSNLIVENRGLLDVDTLKFTLPGDAYQVKVYDTFGAILGLKLDAPVGDYKNASLNLLLNRYKISTDTKFQFTLEYRLPAGNRISVGDERNMIHVPLDRFCTTPWLTRDLKVRFGLAGAVSVNFDSMVVPDEVDSIDGVQYIIYKKDLASPNSPAVIMIDYKFSNFSLQARPLIIAAVSMIVLVAYVSLKKVKMVYGERKEGEGATLETPVEDLKEFTQLFEEKVGLYIEIEHLNDDYQKRKIKKREYSIRIEGSNKQLKELDLDIKKPKSRLIALGGRFKEIIDDLDVLEAERQSVQDTLMALEFRYKEGKIPSKAAFEKLYGENISKLKQIKNAIDSGLNELKGYFL